MPSILGLTSQDAEMELWLNVIGQLSWFHGSTIMIFDVLMKQTTNH